MRCVVATCGLSSDFTTEDITFHSFPTKPSVRAVWLKVLNKDASELLEDSRVCSKHFLKGDLYLNKTGVLRVRGGALPVVNIQTVPRSEENNVKVCRVCFNTDSKLYKMSAYNNLDQAYKILTGLSIENEDELPPYLCSECAKRLLNCVQFRTRSLQAHLLLLEVVKKYKCIKLESIMSLIDNESQLGSQLRVAQTEQHDIGDFKEKSVDETRIDESDNVDIKVEKDSVIDCNTDDENTINDLENLSDLHERDIKIDTDDFNIHDVAEENTSNDDIWLNNVNKDTSIEDKSDLKSKDKESCKPIVHKSITDEQLHDDTVVTDNTRRENGGVKILMIKKSTAGETLIAERKETVKLNSYKDKSGRYTTPQSSRVIADKPVTKTLVTRRDVMLPLDEYTQTNIVKLRKRFTGDEPANTKPKKIFRGKITHRTISDLPLWSRLKSEQEPIPNKKNRFYGIVTHRTINDLLVWSRLKSQTAIRLFTCHLCHYKTGHEREFKSHLETHGDEKPRRADCTTHADEDIFSCDVCQQAFSDKDSLRRHIEITTADKPHVCGVCKKSFKFNFELERHYRMHTGEQRHSCDKCKKKFKSLNSLSLHTKICRLDKKVKKVRNTK